MKCVINVFYCQRTQIVCSREKESERKKKYIMAVGNENCSRSQKDYAEHTGRLIVRQFGIRLRENNHIVPTNEVDATCNTNEIF